MPPAKSTAEHERDGTLRGDRHADRADVLFPKGPPAEPDGLSGHQRYLWNLVTENVPAHLLCPGDAAELLKLCVWWGEFRTLSDNVENETDPQKRLFYLNQLSMASKQVGEGLKRFGLNPAARTLLKVPGGKPNEASPVAALLNFRKQLKPSAS